MNRASRILEATTSLTLKDPKTGTMKKTAPRLSPEKKAKRTVAELPAWKALRLRQMVYGSKT